MHRQGELNNITGSCEVVGITRGKKWCGFSVRFLSFSTVLCETLKMVASSDY